MIAILLFSDDKRADWKVQPAVLLAITVAATNVLIPYALSEGVAVTWWVRSMNKTTQVSDLHNIWYFGSSLRGCLLSGRSFSFIALTGILVALTPINAPLLQRASSVTSAVSQTNVSLHISIAPEFPFGYTGTITGRAHAVALTTSNFSAIFRQEAIGVSINLTDSGCKERCAGTLQGAGYAIECSTSAMPFDLRSSNADGTINRAAMNGTDVFSASFTYREEYVPALASGKPLNFTAVYKSTKDCNGDLEVSSCTLIPALVEYKVLFTNNTIALDPAYSYKNDRLVRYTPPKFNDVVGGSTHGGMALALNGLYASAAHLEFSGAMGYELNISGAPAMQYATTHLNSSDLSTGCEVTWSNPTNNMLETARRLAFRTAVASANPSNATNIQTITATQEQQTLIYKSHYMYLGLALLVTLLGTLSIVPTFFGWWRLGRNVSLSPIEIAKAFDAQALVSSDSNTSVGRLLREVGGRRVMYGAGTGMGGREKLVMREPGLVRAPTDGDRFVGQ